MVDQKAMTLRVPTRATVPRRRLRPNGFTLIELLIVVAIVLIAAALVIPSAGNDAGSRLRGAARVLIADLQATQAMCMAHGDAPRAIVFPDAGDGWRLTLVDSPDQPIPGPAGDPLWTVQFGQGRAASLPGVSVQDVELGGDRMLSFGIYGELDQTEPARITLQADQSRGRITLDPVTGEASFELITGS